MADISQITLPSNKVFNIKDTSARQGLSTKVDIAQGASNANKYLATDENGNVITQELNCATTADIEEMCTTLGLTAVVVTPDDYEIEKSG